MTQIIDINKYKNLCGQDDIQDQRNPLIHITVSHLSKTVKTPCDGSVIPRILQVNDSKLYEPQRYTMYIFNYL